MVNHFRLCTIGVLFCAMVCGAEEREPIEIPFSVNSEVSVRLHDLWRKIRFIEDRIARLEQTVDMVRRSCPECRGIIERQEKLQAEAVAEQVLKEQEKSDKQQTVASVNDSGSSIVCESGLVLSVHARSQAYARQWKAGDKWARDDSKQNTDQMVWIRNLSGVNAQSILIVGAIESGVAQSSKQATQNAITIQSIATDRSWVKMGDGVTLYVKPDHIPKIARWNIGDTLAIGRLRGKSALDGREIIIDGKYSVWERTSGNVELSRNPWR